MIPARRACEHVYVYPGVNGDPSDKRLVEAYSFDPYFNTGHMPVCRRPKVDIDACPCPMCRMKIGIVK